MGLRETPIRERVTTTMVVHGADLNSVIDAATEGLTAFFGRTPYEIIEVRARPSAQTLGGHIFLWEADVEAGEVWS